jgi:hypothetical protein
MATEPKQLSPEEVAERDKQQAEQALGAREGSRFMRRNPDFVQNARNAETLHRKLIEMGLLKSPEDYTVDNLETAFKAVDPALWHNEDDARPAVKEVEEPKPVIVDHSRDFPWGPELTGVEGSKRVNEMSRDEYRKYLTNPKHDAEFQRQVSNLKIKGGRF